MGKSHARLLAMFGLYLALAGPCAAATRPPDKAEEMPGDATTGVPGNTVQLAVQAIALPSLEEAKKELPSIARITSLPLRIARKEEGYAILAGPLESEQDGHELVSQFAVFGYPHAKLKRTVSDREALFQADPVQNGNANADRTVSLTFSKSRNQIEGPKKGPAFAIFPPMPLPDNNLEQTPGQDPAWDAIKRRNWDRAAALFRERARYPGGWARDALWGLAITHYHRQEYSEAAALLKHLLGQGFRPEQTRPLFVFSLYQQERLIQSTAEAEARGRCFDTLGAWFAARWLCQSKWLMHMAKPS